MNWLLGGIIILCLLIMWLMLRELKWLADHNRQLNDLLRESIASHGRTLDTCKKLIAELEVLRG